jgi:F0F1-type ATP synthase membrane subunit c/vacuolar-type H+-ATPase subunit K
MGSPAFTPPPPSSWQGPASAPAPDSSAGGFTPPPPSSWQGPSILPHNQVSPTLPSDLPERMASYLPAAGGLVGSLLAPEVGIPMAALYAGAGGAAGSAITQGSDVALGSPEAPKSFAEFGKNMGLDALGQGLSEGTGRFITSAIGKAFGRYLDPKQLYQSAVMPAPSKGADYANRVVQAGLENRIPVSEAGKNQAHQAWKALNDQITDIIHQDPNKKIDPQKIVQGLNDLRVKWSAGSGDPSYISAIDEVEKNFLSRHGGIQGAPQGMGGNFNGPEAQATKQGLYREIRRETPKAWTGEPVPIKTEAKQVLADALRKELEQAYPLIGSLNQNEGSLIDLDRALSTFVVREGNKRITPYFATLAAVGGGMAGGHTEAGVGVGTAIAAAHFLRMALENPEVKSKLGIALSRAAATKLGKVAATVAPQVPQNVIRFGAAAMQPPPDVTANLAPGRHTFRNGIVIEKSADGTIRQIQ